MAVALVTLFTTKLTNMTVTVLYIDSDLSPQFVF